MRRTISAALALILFLFASLTVPTFAKDAASSDTDTVKVKGYTKKDGTKVEGYERKKTAKKDAVADDTQQVAGYTKKDGTKVAGYTRKKATKAAK
jgi:hypothetical protein